MNTIDPELYGCTKSPSNDWFPFGTQFFRQAIDEIEQDLTRRMSYEVRDQLEEENFYD
jgi:hypothetical protein